MPRGALQMVFHYTPYDELRRLGLAEKTEEAARKAFPALTGMLVVNEVLPGGPADGTLQPGDMLVRVNGKLVSRVRAARTRSWTTSVGSTVELELERGGKPITAQAHRRRPARHHALCLPGVRRRRRAHACRTSRRGISTSPVSGVYVANPGYIFGAAGVPRGAVIASANGKDTPNLAAFEAVVEGARAMASASPCVTPRSMIPNGIERAQRAHGSPLVPRASTACVTTQRASGNARRSPALGAPKPEVGGTTRFSKSEDPRAAALAPSLVRCRLRHAVFGLRHHRAQLSRHGPGGRCGARPRGRRSQHRAGLDGRRAHHVRGHARGARQGGVRASAAQPRHRRATTPSSSAPRR